MFPSLEGLVHLAQSENFSVVFAITQWEPNEEEFLTSAAEELGFAMIPLDIYNHPEYNPTKIVLHPLDGHPSALANRIKAELLAEALQGHIPE